MTRLRLIALATAYTLTGLAFAWLATSYLLGAVGQ